MFNKDLAKDYLSRSLKRLKALETLFQEEAWADVVREAQEIVELSLKGLLRHAAIDVPRVHDVSEILIAEKSSLPKELQKHIPKFTEISRTLRRDRELAFYGSEDLTPQDFYKKADAEEALEFAKFVAETIATVVLQKSR
ncbi:MAG: DNA-binding protein [Bdellovibrionales bacterium CG10_big_fil_rev_8_21_14_0_10_45_34]|nr:MAG: DNA-binding protein [Bdellovibrionales bacterium CG10_big_fil_rev_8_21_14_0_10_45_34]